MMASVRLRRTCPVAAKVEWVPLVAWQAPDVRARLRSPSGEPGESLDLPVECASATACRTI
jgi:hypothetical protein